MIHELFLNSFLNRTPLKSPISCLLTYPSSVFLTGAAAHWSGSGVKWILALDENCGPTLPLVTFTSGRPFVSIPSTAASESDIKYNQDYYSVKHMSKYLLTDVQQQKDQRKQQKLSTGTATVRVTTTPTTSGAVSLSSLIVETFYNAETNVVTVIAMNLDHSKDVTASFTQGGKSFSDVLPMFSTKIFQWIKE